MDIKRPDDKNVVRPSKMPQIAQCPYSFKNCLGWEERSDEADRGTVMHYAMANGVEKALQDGMLLTAADQAIVNYLRSIYVEGQTDEGETLLQELKVSVVYGDREVTRGTLDYLLLNKSKTEGLLIDWKFGNMRVNNGPTNMQLQAYTEGAFQKVETLEKLKVLIIQPSVMTKEEIENPEGFMITREESENNFLLNVASVEEAAREATAEDAVPSNENCRFCRKINCPAWREMCEDALRITLGGEKALELTAKYAESMKKPEEDMKEYVDDMLDKVADAEEFLKEKKKTLTEFAISVGGTERYAVQKAVRTTIDWETVAKALNPPPELIAVNTKKKEGAPYLRRKTRRKTQWN